MRSQSALSAQRPAPERRRQPSVSRPRFCGLSLSLQLLCLRLRVDCRRMRGTDHPGSWAEGPWARAPLTPSGRRNRPVVEPAEHVDCAGLLIERHQELPLPLLSPTPDPHGYVLLTGRLHRDLAVRELLGESLPHRFSSKSRALSPAVAFRNTNTTCPISSNESH